jgi:hypothetical protein
LTSFDEEITATRNWDSPEDDDAQWPWFWTAIIYEHLDVAIKCSQDHIKRPPDNLPRYREELIAIAGICKSAVASYDRTKGYETLLA